MRTRGWRETSKETQAAVPRDLMSWDFQNIGHVGRREAGALMSSHSSETGLGRPRLDSTRTLEKGASRSFGFLVGL